MLDGIYYNTLKGKGEEVDELTHELEVTVDSLKRTQMALQELNTQIDKLIMELSLA
jgi:hypothetical protein